MKKKIIAAALTAVILINSVCFSAAAIQGDALIGDVNHDGIVNIDDATVVQRIVAGLEEIGEQNTEEGDKSNSGGEESKEGENKDSDQPRSDGLPV